jgi:hypothetical protein
MLKKLATRALLTVCALLWAVATPLLAQGVSRQDYNGLDKYLEQGKIPSFSFDGKAAYQIGAQPF